MAYGCPSLSLLALLENMIVYILAGWLPCVVSRLLRCARRFRQCRLCILFGLFLWAVCLDLFHSSLMVNCCIVCLFVCFLASLNAVLLALLIGFLCACWIVWLLVRFVVACLFRLPARLASWWGASLRSYDVNSGCQRCFFQRPIKSWRVEASKTICSVSNIWFAGTLCLTGIQPTFQGQAIIIKTMVISCNISNCYHDRTNLGLPKNGVYPETAILMQEISDTETWQLKSLNLHL